MGCTENLMSLLPGLRNQRKEGGGSWMSMKHPFLYARLCAEPSRRKHASGYCGPWLTAGHFAFLTQP